MEQSPIPGLDVPAQRSLSIFKGTKSRMVVSQASEPASLPKSERINGDTLLWQRSRELFAFLKPIEQAIRLVRSKGHRRTKLGTDRSRRVAHLVLSVVRSITERETGVLALEVDVPLLGERLSAGPTEVSIVEGLVRRAERALQGPIVSRLNAGLEHQRAGGATQIVYDLARELEELAHFVTWYARRRITLLRLAHERFSLDEQGRRSSERVFALQVLHDQRVFGVKGCAVRCAANLVGHDGETLWCRVSFEQEGRPVTVRPGWESWGEQSDESGAQSDESGAQSDESTLLFASLVPVRPDAQQAIVDQIVTFVPYGALNISSGEAVQLFVSISDAEGKEILSASTEQVISIPSSELTVRSVPSPQSVGIWPVDAVRGDRVSRLRAKSGYKQVRGWELLTISVTCDLLLSMRASSEIQLECRLLDHTGRPISVVGLVPSGDADAGEPSTFRYRRALYPRTAWARFDNLSIDIPVAQLDLAAGVHEVTCELVLIGEDGRVLCGDIVRFPLKVPGASNLPNPNIELESFEVDPEWQFGGIPTVRLQATLSPRHGQNGAAHLASGKQYGAFAPYRVVLSLERESGELIFESIQDGLGVGFLPLVRGVCVEGHSGFREHSVVCNFPRVEIGNWLSLFEGRNSAAVRSKVVARVKAITLDGQLFLDQQRDVFMKPKTPSQQSLMVTRYPLNSPVMIDVVAQRLLKSPIISIRLLVNVPSTEADSSDYSVRFVLPGTDLVEQRVLRANPWWLRRGLELMQLSLECEFSVGLTDVRAVQVELLDTDGMVLQSIEQSVVRSSIPAEEQSHVALNGVRADRRGLLGLFRPRLKVAKV